jgi:nucleolar complex protein 2
MAGDQVARRQIAKFKQKDRAKAEKKQRVAQKEEAEEKVQLVRQKQVDDFVTQAKTAKGKGYDKMSVDDFMSYGFAEDSDGEDNSKAGKKAAAGAGATTKTKTSTTKKSAPIQPKKLAVPLPSRIIPIKTGKGKVVNVPLDDEEDDEDHMDFSDDDEGNDGDFYSDDIDNQNDDDYNGLDVDGIPADDDEDMEFDEDDLYAGDDDDEDDEGIDGGYFDKEDLDEDDEDGEYDEESHEKQLRQLKVKDPELYKYLLQTSPDMLKFDQSNDNDDDDSGSDSDDDGKDNTKGIKKALTIESLTSEQFAKIKGKFDRRKYNAKDLLLVIRLFKSAVLVRKKANVMQTRAKKNGKNISDAKSSKVDMKLIMLTSSPLYQHFLQFSLRVIPCALVELLYLNNKIPIPFLQEASPQEPQSRSPDQGISWKELAIALSDGVSPLQGKLQSLIGWGKVSRLTRTYFLTVFTLLRDVIDNGLVRLILRSILPAIPLLESVTIPTPLLLKRLLHFWCYSADVSYTSKEKSKSSTSTFRTDHVSRIEAFLVLRRLAICLPHSSHIKEAVMKGVYQNFAKVAKHVTSYTYPTIVFLTNCVVELYGIDGVLAYQLTFIYLRQLATQLRTYLLTPSSKGLRSIYNWQFINCLRVWGQVLSTYAIETTSALRPLIYPYSQICTTILTLSTAPAFFPVKITVCELLSELMFKSQVYIPIATHLLNIFRHPSFSKKKHTTITKHQTHLQNELTFKLHIAEGLLDSLQYKENIAQRTLDVLTRHLSIVADAVFFPEYSYPIRTSLKQLLTMVQIPTITRDLRQLQTAINESVHYVLERRGKVAFSPRDIITKQVNSLTLMSNTVALNSLHQGSGGSGTVGAYKPTSLHKLWEKRLNAKQLDEEESAQKRQQVIDELGEPDATDEDDLDDDEEGEEEEEEEEEDLSRKRKSLSHRDDYEDDDEDMEDMYGDEDDDFGFDDEDDDGDQADTIGDFDMLDDSD